MKKIINNRMYDTEKAHEIGNDYHGMPSDLDYISETLYRKRTGEYFIYGEGGPRSKYSRAISQNSWSGSEDIRPLTAEEARLWAEQHLHADDYEAEFGEIAEDDSRMAISITLPRSMVEKCRRDAAAAGVTLSGLIESRLTRD